MTNDLFNLTGKVAIVTGGAGLIGSAFCEALSGRGANVVVADINEQAGREVASNLPEKSIFTKVDITSSDSVQQLRKHVIKEFGKIDVLINNAYPRNENYGNPYEKVNIEDWRENIDLHLNGYYLVTKIISEHMINRNSGKIINLGSIYGIQAPDFNTYEGTNMTSPVEYSAIKGGILNLTRYLASYLGEYGINVNAISPGGVLNEQNEDFVENYEKRTPLGRMAKTQDLKGPVVFLSSDASDYVTGHNLVVDGGWTIC